MSRIIKVLLTGVLMSLPVHAQESSIGPSQLRPVHTYSIVARDQKTGELGVAVQSHWFSVGTLVPWAEAGVGAVASQSFIDVRYGVSGLDLMRGGLTAKQALDKLLSEDGSPAVRQVAMIDASGKTAAHTGKGCIRHAGHLQGDHYVVQANLMEKPGVPEAMARAFKHAKGSLAERLMKTLQAAQATGGDLRGKQSAAILVVKAKASDRPWEDRVVDLHVEDHPTPLKELRRLLTLNTAYHHMNLGDHALEKDDVEGALAHYGQAEALAPGNLEMKFWHAVSLMNARRTARAVDMFRSVFERDKRWRELVSRLVDAGILSADKAVLDQLLVPAH
jgi:uncharacterized Ntn-hydrolase superfamily protein